MSTFVLLPFMLGAVLGTRFKVLVLLPTIGTILAIIFVAGIAGDKSASDILVEAGLALSCLQFGYVSGTLLLLRVAPDKAGALAKVSRSAWLSE